MLGRYSVKKPYTVIVGIILVIVLGVISFSNMTTDLLPSMNFPYVIVYTTYVGATPEQIETEVTRPLESSFATLTDIKNINSQSSDNLSLVILEFNETADLNTAMIEINSEITTLSAGWSDSVGAPAIMKINPDMLPVSIVSVSMEDMDIYELSEYVEETLIPEYESINGVASVSASGLITQEVDVTIEQDRIDILNNAILRDIDAELADIEEQLNDAQAQISDGKSQLARQKASVLAQLNSAAAQLANGETQLATAITTLKTKRAELVTMLAEVNSAITQLETMVNLTDEERQILITLQQKLGELLAEKELIEQQLTALENGEGNETLSTERANAVASRDALIAERSRLALYIEDLNAADPDAIAADIEALNTQIAAAQTSLATAQTDLDAKTAARNATQTRIDELTLLISEQENPAVEESPTPESTPGEETPNPENADATPAPENGENVDATPNPESGENADATPNPENGENADATPNPENGENADATPNPENGENVDATPNPEGNENEDDTADLEDSEEEDDVSEDENSENSDVVSESENSEDLNAESENSEEEDSSDSADSEDDASDSQENESAGSDDQSTGDDVSDSTQQNTEDGDSAAVQQNTEDDISVVVQQNTEGVDSAAVQQNAEDDDSAAVRQNITETPVSENIDSDNPSSETPTAQESASVDTAEVIAFNPFAAYADEQTLDEMKAELAAAEETLAAQNLEVEAAQAEFDRCSAELADLQAQLESKQKALEDVQSGDVTTRVEAAQREIDRLDARIRLLDTEIESIDKLLSGDSEAISLARQALDALNENIDEIESSDEYKALQLITDKDALNAQYAEALKGKAQLESGISQIDAILYKLEQGIIPGGYIDGIDQDMTLSSARSQLASARSQALSAFATAEAELASASAELATARKEFEDKRDEALANAGLDGIITVDTVAGLLGAQNLSMPAGYVYDLSEDEYLVRVGDKFTTLEELRSLKLFSIGMESVDEIRLTDVARVEVTDNRAEAFTKVDNQDGILLSIEKQSTFSTTEVSDRVAEKSAELVAEIDGLRVVDMFNQGDYINIIVDSVLDNMVSGAFLAVLVLLIFLLDWRPTFIVALSIPLSVVVAFVCMYFTGITLNVLSLSGLVLGIGMLVDNSIVAIENIYRLRNEENMPILHACVLGAQQVSGSLFASTLTTICVFAPIVFVEGMARDLFTDLGLTIAYSLLASLVVALTVVPSMAAGLLKKPRKEHRNRLFSAFQTGYVRLLKGALKIKPLVLLIAIAALVVTAMQVPKMGMSFMPEVSSTQMSASLPIDPEQELKPQQERAMELMSDLLEIDGIETIGLNSGGGLMSTGAESLTYYIIVAEDSGRKNSEIAEDIRAAAAGLNMELSVQTSTMDISMMTGSGISIDITGSEIDTLQSIARDVADIARSLDGAVEVSDGLEDAVPEIRITVDKELAADNNLTVGQVLQFVATKLAGKIEITQATLDGKNMSVYMIDGRNSTLTPDTLQDLEMEVTSGDMSEMIRIGDIATIEEAESFSSISRSNQQRIVSVSFQIAEGYSANHVSAALEEKLADYQTPEGYSVSLSGENETVLGLMEDLVFMVVIAVLMIFLIMVAQFQSFKSPIIVLFTIPLAFTGGLLALLITDMDLSIVAMIGFLVLSGVIVNNGIVFVDTVNQLRIGGMSKKAALVETGRLRLRPILMTTLTTVLGMSTMALAQGMGAEMMQPMAIVTIGGLSYATLMTLFVVPVLYDIVNGEKMSAREIQMAKEAAGMAGESDETPAPVPVTAGEPDSPLPEPEAESRPEPEPAPQSEPAPQPEPPKRRRGKHERVDVPQQEAADAPSSPAPVAEPQAPQYGYAPPYGSPNPYAPGYAPYPPQYAPYPPQYAPYPPQYAPYPYGYAPQSAPDAAAQQEGQGQPVPQGTPAPYPYVPYGMPVYPPQGYVYGAPVYPPQGQPAQENPVNPQQ